MRTDNGPLKSRGSSAEVRMWSACVLVAAAAYASGQATAPSDEAKISRQGSRITFQISSRRALYSAARAIANEYGWTVDYEEAAIATSNVEDIAPPAWKASHPFEVGVLVPRQEQVTLAVDEGSTIRASKKKVGVMAALAAAHTQRQPARETTVQVEPDERITVIDGQTQGLRSVGDSTISVQEVPSNGVVAATAIASRCSAASGNNLVLGTIPVNLLAQLKFTPQADQTTCRGAINSLLNTASTKLAYSILYDPASRSFVLNIEPVRRTFTDTNGFVRSEAVGTTQ